MLAEVTNGALDGGGGKCATQAWLKRGGWTPGMQLKYGDRIG